VRLNTPPRGTCASLHGPLRDGKAPIPAVASVIARTYHEVSRQRMALPLALIWGIDIIPLAGRPRGFLPTACNDRLLLRVFFRQIRDAARGAGRTMKAASSHVLPHLGVSRGVIHGQRFGYGHRCWEVVAKIPRAFGVEGKVG